MKLVKAAMIGDVVGVLGLEVLEARLPALIKERQIDFVTVNGENAAEGFGITETDYRRIIAAGADVVTSGNHVWEKRDFWPVLESEKNMLRPANYPRDTVGSGFVLIEKNGVKWAVINLQGREYMNAIDCPFQCFDHCASSACASSACASSACASLACASLACADKEPADADAGPPVIIVDFHAESSREKEALAYYADGRASLIAGTHTHVQTADERILPKGSAYITDLGMTGIADSVIGMDPKICLERVRRQILYHMETAADNKTGQMRGVIAEIDADTGKAVSILRI